MTVDYLYYLICDILFQHTDYVNDILTLTAL